MSTTSNACPKCGRVDYPHVCFPVSDSSRMSFEEAMIRAKAAHVARRAFDQPGNDYRTEYECSCGRHVYADRFAQHLIDAADAFRDGFHLDGSKVLWSERVPLAPDWRTRRSPA